MHLILEPFVGPGHRQQNFSKPIANKYDSNMILYCLFLFSDIMQSETNVKLLQVLFVLEN